MAISRTVLPPRSLVVLLGPTAVGKSAFAVTLAKKFDGVVLSADSRQVYRGLDLGTGKITRREMAGVRHELLDIASPRGQYTAARFRRDAYRLLSQLPTSRQAMLVGGSPFYIEAVLHPDRLADVPPHPALRQKLERKTTPQLLTLLRQRCPEKYATIDQHNRRRLIRALEISYAPSSVRPVVYPPLRVLKLGLRLPNHQLFKRIDHRVDTRLRCGMLAEVARLQKQGMSWKKLDSLGLEYRFLSRHLRGQLTKAEAVTQLKSAIHDFARRQMTWWKRDPEIHWVRSLAEAERLIRLFQRAA